MGPLAVDWPFSWSTTKVMNFLNRMERQFQADFAPASGHWRPEDREALLREAFRRFDELRPPTAGEAEERKIWNDIVADFHRGGYWGRKPFPGPAPKEKKPLTEEQRRRKELLPYIWAFVQSTIIMKLVIYYFGINSADDPSLFNYIGLGLGIFISFFSLFFFAWRHHRRLKAKGLDDTE